MITLGKIINKFRKEKNISMDKFSEMSGLSKGYISMLEKNLNPKTGAAITPSLETYQAVSKAIHIDFDELIKSVDSNSEVNLNSINYIPSKNMNNLSNDEIKLLHYYNSSNKLGKERILTNSKEMAVLYPITRDEILQFFEDKKIAAYGGMNLNSMSDEELIDLYNDIKGTLK
ncbi:helix-turn-helix domain-containing protein [Helcococcus ovis]|uniref:helix-turn-helix domain-containing protein n=1 Tax=Helcococcus TaxID=31983 RepID=UPI0038BAE91E